MNSAHVRDGFLGPSRRQVLELGAVAGVLAVTPTANGLMTRPIPAADSDPGSGRRYDPATTPQQVEAASFLVQLLPGRRILTEDFAAFEACDYTGATLIYVSDGVPAVGRGTVYGSNGWLQAPLHVPAGATIDRVDVFGRRTTSGSQLWKVQCVPVFAIDVTDPVIDLSPNITTATTTGPTHGSVVYDPPIQVYDGWGYNVVMLGTSLQSQAAGFIVQYTPPRRDFVPITPARVFDSRFASFGGPLAGGVPRTADVKHAIDVRTGVTTATNIVPLGAAAVAYNLTVTQTAGPGYLALAPGTSTALTASAINWTVAGATLANGGVIALGTGPAERKITFIPFGAATHAILDVTGYYI